VGRGSPVAPVDAPKQRRGRERNDRGRDRRNRVQEGDDRRGDARRLRTSHRLAVEDELRRHRSDEEQIQRREVDDAGGRQRAVVAGVATGAAVVARDEQHRSDDGEYDEKADEQDERADERGGAAGREPRRLRDGDHEREAEGDAEQRREQPANDDVRAEHPGLAPPEGVRERAEQAAVSAVIAGRGGGLGHTSG